MTLPQIPTDTLRATFQREQPYRINWPSEYEKAMADPLISRIVEMLARHQTTAFGRRKANRWKQRELDIPREIDSKRRASGEDTRDLVCVHCRYIFASTDTRCRRCGTQETFRE